MEATGRAAGANAFPEEGEGSLAFNILQEQTYIDLWCFGEGSHRMNVVVEDDHPHHHSQAEGYRLFVCKPTLVLPAIRIYIKKKGVLEIKRNQGKISSATGGNRGIDTTAWCRVHSSVAASQNLPVMAESQAIFKGKTLAIFNFAEACLSPSATYWPGRIIMIVMG